MRKHAAPKPQTGLAPLTVLGIGERPGRLAEGVLEAVALWTACVTG